MKDNLQKRDNSSDLSCKNVKDTETLQALSNNGKEQTNDQL